MRGKRRLPSPPTGYPYAPLLGSERYQKPRKNGVKNDPLTGHQATFRGANGFGACPEYLSALERSTQILFRSMSAGYR
jgi:hypothetical protein